MAEAHAKGWTRFSLEVRQDMPRSRQLAILAGGLLAGLAIAATILMLAGVGLADLYSEFVVSIFTNTTSLSAVMVQAAPLLIVGLAAAIAFRVRFWNIGLEGQMIFGSIFCTLVAINDWGPEWARLAAMFIAVIVGCASLAEPSTCGTPCVQSTTRSYRFDAVGAFDGWQVPAICPLLFSSFGRHSDMPAGQAMSTAW